MPGCHHQRLQGLPSKHTKQQAIRESRTTQAAWRHFNRAAYSLPICDAQSWVGWGSGWGECRKFAAPWLSLHSPLCCLWSRDQGPRNYPPAPCLGGMKKLTMSREWLLQQGWPFPKSLNHSIQPHEATLSPSLVNR